MPVFLLLALDGNDQEQGAVIGLAPGQEACCRMAAGLLAWCALRIVAVKNS
jgi:hypothetical protein